MSEKRPTPKMVELLMECHEREILKQEPLTSLMITQATKGLVNRGFLKAIPEAKKPRLMFKITPEGKEYLEEAKGLLNKKATG